MIQSTARPLVIGAINKENFYYSHTLPAKYSDWIDGLAWSSCGRGAALLASDWELASLLYEYGARIMSVGKDARNYAPLQVKPDWVASTTMPGFWYTVKPQAMAGPLALLWANGIARKLGKPQIDNDFNVIMSAKAMAASGFLYGILAKKSAWLRGYIDSMWLSHLYLGKKPASTMMWMAEENPFFAYIAGKKQSVAYPNMARTTEGATALESSVVPLEQCEPSAWIFRRDPYNRYNRLGTQQPESYTPLAQLVGDYLQSTL